MNPLRPINPPQHASTLLTYDQYLDRWEDIYSLFSREAVLSGSLEKFAEETKRKRKPGGIEFAFEPEQETACENTIQQSSAASGS